MFSYNILDDDQALECPDIFSLPGAVDDRHLSKSGLRALEVLEFFAHEQRPARAVEIAQALEMSPSSADQLLKTLVVRAYLVFDSSTKLYHPSPRLLGFADYLGQQYYGNGSLRLLMEDLCAETGCAVSVSTRSSNVMQLTEIVVPPDQTYKRTRGHVFPIFYSAAGAAILATLPRSTVMELIVLNEDLLGGLAHDLDRIFKQLSHIREVGHAFGGLTEHTEYGTYCSIAVALPPTKFSTELALSVRGSTDVLSGKRWNIAATIHERIDERLGGIGGHM